MSASSISRRIEDSIKYLGNKNYEAAFIHLFPALDKTAKKRRSNKQPGERIKSFISDEEVIISAIATNNIWREIEVDGINFPTAIYKFGRTSIAHEGELDKRLKITEDGSLRIGYEWHLPASYITALIISVIVAPENKNEKISEQIAVNLFGEEFIANSLWGQKEALQTKICLIWKNPELFTNR